MEKIKRDTRGYGWLFLFGIVIGVGLAIVAIKCRRAPVGNNGGSQPKDLSSEKAQDIVRRARIAVGELENDRFSDADQSLVELLRDVPDEPIAARNWMIARLRLFEDGKFDEGQVNQALE